jgi:hypothetical protein
MSGSALPFSTGESKLHWGSDGTDMLVETRLSQVIEYVQLVILLGL